MPTLKAISRLLRRKKSRKVNLKRMRSKSETAVLKESRETASSISVTKDQHGQLHKEYLKNKEKKHRFASRHATIDESFSGGTHSHEECIETELFREHARVSMDATQIRNALDELSTPQAHSIARKSGTASNTYLARVRTPLEPRTPVNSMAFLDKSEVDSKPVENVPSPTRESMQSPSTRHLVKRLNVDLLASPRKERRGTRRARTSVTIPSSSSMTPTAMIFNHVPSPTHVDGKTPSHLMSPDRQGRSAREIVTNHSIFIRDSMTDSIITRSNDDIAERREASPSVMLIQAHGELFSPMERHDGHAAQSPTRASIEESEWTECTQMELVRPVDFRSASHRILMDRQSIDDCPSPSRVSISRMSLSQVPHESRRRIGSVLGDATNIFFDEMSDAVTPMATEAPSNWKGALESGQSIVEPSFARSSTIACDFSIGADFARQRTSSLIISNEGDDDVRLPKFSSELNLIQENSLQMEGAYESTQSGVDLTKSADEITDFAWGIGTALGIQTQVTSNQIPSEVRRPCLEMSGYLQPVHRLSTRQDRDNDIRNSYLPRLSYLEGTVNKLVASNGALMNGFRTFLNQYSLEKEFQMTRKRPSRARSSTTRSWDRMASLSSSPTTGSSHSREQALRRLQFNKLVKIKAEVREQADTAFQMQSQVTHRQQLREYRKTLDFQASPIPDTTYVPDIRPMPLM